MKARVLVAVVGIPALVFVLGFAPEGATALLVAAMCAIGAYEFMQAVTGKKKGWLVYVSVVTALLLPLRIYNSSMDFVFVTDPIWYDAWTEMSAPKILERLMAVVKSTALAPACLVFVFVLVVFFYTIWCYEKEKAIPFSHVTAAIFGGVIFPLMLSCLLWIRLMDNGMALVFLPLCISFGSDTFALFAGLLFGKHKLAPHVSPKKTVEGAFGGLFGGVVGMLLFKWVVKPLLGLEFGYGAAVLFGLVGSVISQIGDLSFSVIKREFGVKDYGKLLPGHGGILDRFDSVTFVAPVVWILLSLV